MKDNIYKVLQNQTIKIEEAKEYSPELQKFIFWLDGVKEFSPGIISELCDFITQCIKNDTHPIDILLVMGSLLNAMYIDDIILSNESSMTVKASSVGDATAFRVNDNKYYFTGNNKSSTAWNTAANWNRGEVPSSTSEVFILASVEIATGTTVHVDKVNIVTGGSITPPNGSSMTASGHLTSRTRRARP